MELVKINEAIGEFRLSKKEVEVLYAFANAMATLPNYNSIDEMRRELDSSLEKFLSPPSFPTFKVGRCLGQYYVGEFVSPHTLDSDCDCEKYERIEDMPEWHLSVFVEPIIRNNRDLLAHPRWLSECEKHQYHYLYFAKEKSRNPNIYYACYGTGHQYNPGFLDDLVSRIGRLTNPVVHGLSISNRDDESSGVFGAVNDLRRIIQLYQLAKRIIRQKLHSTTDLSIDQMDELYDLSRPFDDGESPGFSKRHKQKLAKKEYEQIMRTVLEGSKNEQQEILRKNFGKKNN